MLKPEVNLNFKKTFWFATISQNLLYTVWEEKLCKFTYTCIYTYIHTFQYGGKNFIFIENKKYAISSEKSIVRFKSKDVRR